MHKRLKIAILIDQLVSGGVQKAAIQEAKNLQKLGYTVALFVLVQLTYKYQYEDISEGLKVTYLSDHNPKLLRRAIRIPYFAFLTHLHLLNPFFAHRYKVLKKYDFIISHGTTTCITAAAISRNLQIPYMAFIWDPMIFILKKVYGKSLVRFFFPLIVPLVRYYERSFLTTAAIVATTSNLHKDFIKENYGVEPIIIHPGGISPDKIPSKTAARILGYTRWEMGKNPNLFIWLAKKLPRAKFLLAGYWNNPQEEKEFKLAIKNNRLEDRIELFSPVTQRDLEKIAARSIVWVHPNLEAFGMAGLEMAALGVPVIIPKGSGLTEIFEDKIHGFFPSVQDKKAFLENIRYLINHRKTAIKMGYDAAQIAKSYTWEKHSKVVIERIEKYLSQKKIVAIACAFVTKRATGGGDQFLIKLASHAPDNFHLTVVLPKVGLFHWQKAIGTPENVRYIVVPQTPFDNKENPILLFMAYLLRSLCTYLLLPKLPKYDLIHTSTDILPDTLPAYLIKNKNPKIKWAARFFHFIESPTKREGTLWVNLGSYLIQQLSLRLLKKADVVMINSTSLTEKFKEKDISISKLQIHPGGVETQLISNVPEKKSMASDALFIGRLLPHKGVFDALEIWKEVTKIIPKAKLFMIGYGPQDVTENINSKIKNYKLSKNVFLTGYIHNPLQIAAYCNSSKLLLFLDHEAGFGLVIVEAMAAGLPTVAYNLPIFGNAYKRGFITAPLRNTEKIAQITKELLTNESKYKKLSQEARTEAARFDWGKISRKFYDSLESM
ncbi:hypothetical protein A3D81_00555 [Candidatus Curtissbacteria bacterium RIFCSPHIGHO2_02_FULL_40_17]|uniref:Glycosyl transferase family 1 domain-containing protein n=4 Tax=Candidatus Curtissiibacteriota TaxID=1752717 RepID=A0A1F5GI80_9BACT|nr:MAG: hypothetical protein A2693_00870 [Candidatus Curtissbacteria bacterium RIFCSPHIGHO2_01_FULL_40_12]OGD91586.1 MAG: hypothetical protein A3D81_00555 [Candidatus Curtissbacteria bacterium RIFCSPHIGHO2_02_FULL_40_17]OGE03447.1 MAG: hypothetical protein A3F45_04415 [Candidatus Curtissbacteria bacterium RIFCSPHIGHO2_12_FULL_41_17]OGE07890.1 MAG: hypothetical protein A3I53_04400 [Candidatus Curtissbacteria bacterium RIFCSPLOWO2_02_FULL_40_13b]